MHPIALTIAGSDSGGGAGIQADLKTFSALGVYGASAITAITAQNTRAVNAVQLLDPDIVVAQIDAVFEDLDVGAVKIGMLGSAVLARAVTRALRHRAVPVILDPVMVSKTGSALLAPDAVAELSETLVPRADLVTPNLPEAARLLGMDEAKSVSEMEWQGTALAARGPRAVLLKGGHGKGAVCTDLLVIRDGPIVKFEVPRQATLQTHGTGCTLSAAIAACLARGKPLEAAVAEAHDYLQGAMAEAEALAIGHGRGPVHHFHAFWKAHGR